MCTTHINNHRFSIHYNCIGTGTHTHTHTHTPTGLQGVPSISESTPCACSLLPGALIGSCPIRPSNHIKQSESVHRLANNLQFYNNTTQLPPPFPVSFHSLTLLSSQKWLMSCGEFKLLVNLHSLQLQVTCTRVPFLFRLYIPNLTYTASHIWCSLILFMWFRKMHL